MCKPMIATELTNKNNGFCATTLSFGICDRQTRQYRKETVKRPSRIVMTIHQVKGSQGDSVTNIKLNILDMTISKI